MASRDRQTAIELVHKLKARADRTTFHAERESCQSHIDRLTREYDLSPADLEPPGPTPPTATNPPPSPPPSGSVAVFINGRFVGYAAGGTTVTFGQSGAFSWTFNI